MGEVQMKAVGILGIGKYLPPEIRRNDWWPAEVVERWAQSRPAAPPPVIDGLGAMAARVLEELGSQAQDPFQGAVERHVMGDESITDMEQRAAQDPALLVALDAALIEKLAPRIISEEWSARRIEQYITALRNGTNEESTTSPSKDASRYETVASRLAKRFSTDIHIKTGAKGSGKITISFKDETELERIQKLLEK